MDATNWTRQLLDAYDTHDLAGAEEAARSLLECLDAGQEPAFYPAAKSRELAEAVIAECAAMRETATTEAA